MVIVVYYARKRLGSVSESIELANCLGAGSLVGLPLQKQIVRVLLTDNCRLCLSRASGLDLTGLERLSTRDSLLRRNWAIGWTILDRGGCPCRKMSFWRSTKLVEMGAQRMSCGEDLVTRRA